MALIDWSSEFETGIAEVDHEHRELVDLINRLHAELLGSGGQAATSAFLGEVFARISAHFALEEANMRRYGYDEYADHKADHEHLLDELRDLMEACEAGDFAGSVEALSNAVRDWFVVHFRTRDARLHRIMGH